MDSVQRTDVQQLLLIISALCTDWNILRDTSVPGPGTKRALLMHLSILRNSLLFIVFYSCKTYILATNPFTGHEFSRWPTQITWGHSLLSWLFAHHWHRKVKFYLTVYKQCEGWVMSSLVSLATCNYGITKLPGCRKNSSIVLISIIFYVRKQDLFSRPFLCK